MFDLFGAETPLAVRFFIAFIVVFVLIGAVAWLVRRFGANRLGAAARGRQPRLAVIEAGAVDGRRKLVIVRRDNVEHLIMIGGPTDILIEANIVRAQAAGREVARAAPPPATERPAPAAESGTSWPLAPEPGAPRPRPAAEETLQWHPVEPVVPMPPAPPPRRPARVDTLAGLANELSKPNNGHSDVTLAPHRPAPSLDIIPPRPMATPMVDIPAVKPVVPAPAKPAAQPSAGGDPNLADMAQRLEAALRRPGNPAAKPAAPGPAAPAPADTAPAAATPADPALASAPRIDSVNGARDKAAKPEPAAAPDEGGAAFGSLEQEMANLLGRPSGKA
jgi:hypothetical protein